MHFPVVLFYLFLLATYCPPPFVRHLYFLHAWRFSDLRTRESNFAFPAQNRAAVCISSELYDRHGAPLALLFSIQWDG
jgi:hypothetical protein